MSAADEVLRLVERLARALPEVPRLAILDAVDHEWHRLRAAGSPFLAAVVGAAAERRLNAGAALAF